MALLVEHNWSSTLNPNVPLCLSSTAVSPPQHRRRVLNHYLKNTQTPFWDFLDVHMLLSEIEMEEDEIILVHRGYWDKSVYKNGEEELLFMSLQTISFANFLDDVHRTVRADRSNFDYVLHCLVPTKEHGTVKSKITSDRDLQRFANMFKTSKIFVTVEPKYRGPNPLSLNGSPSFSQPGHPFPYGGQNPVGHHFPTGYGMNTMHCPVPNISAPYIHGVRPNIAPHLLPPLIRKAGPNSAPVVNQLGPSTASRDLRGIGIDTIYNKDLQARFLIQSLVYGDHVQSWEKLPSYLYMLKKENPGSIAHFETDDKCRFEHVFIALGASIIGFRQHCRPVIVVDATYVEGEITMFVAATRDGNEQTFPLAFGLSSKGKDKSWHRFMIQLRNAYGCPNSLLIVSKQDKSIRNALNLVYPGTPQGICSFNLQMDLRNFQCHVVRMFTKASNAYRLDMYKKYLMEIKELNMLAFNELRKAMPERWARSCCPVRRYQFMSSNAAEDINASLRWAKKLPVCSLLECVRNLHQLWFQKQRAASERMKNVLTPVVASRLRKEQLLGQRMSVSTLGSGVYNLKDGVHNYTVNLGKGIGTCTCRVFELDMIPCSHATKAISEAKQSPVGYVHMYYRTDTLRKLYSTAVKPVSHPRDWNIPTSVGLLKVKPPANSRQACQPVPATVPPPGEACNQSREPQLSRNFQSGQYQAHCPINSSPTSETASGSGSNGIDQPVSRKRSAERKCGFCQEVGHTKRTCIRPIDSREGSSEDEE